MVSASPEMKEEKFYKSLEPGLTTINNECIAMETDEKSSSVKITLKVLEELITKMKAASKLFEWLFNRVTYVGSYFDGLRVKEATEFDINVVLKLPLIYDKFRIKRTQEHPGFIQVNLKDAKLSGEKLTKHQNETDEIFKWVNKDGYLSHRKVLQWWESVFSKLQGLTTLVVENSEYKITAFKKSGPAMTAHISGEKFDIDVDLVPVIEFPKTVDPPQPIRWKDNEGVWYIVPKPRDDNELLWRLSFPEQEKKIMNGLHKLKMVNRFLKRVRDVFNWRPLASYYIKSIFLWEAYERKSKKDETFFYKNLGYLFVYFLGKLQGYLEQGNLPFFWDKNMNLLINIKRPTLEGYGARIKKVKTQMEKFIQDKNTNELSNLMRSLFYSANECSSGNGSDTGSKAIENFLLIDLEPPSDSEPSPSSYLPTDLFGPAPSTELFSEVYSQSLQCSDLPSPSESQDSAISSTANSSGNGHVQCVLDLETSKEKSSLAIEECKIRVQIAQIDLKTALMNLRAAEKRYEKVNLEFNMVSKMNDSR